MKWVFLLFSLPIFLFSQPLNRASSSPFVSGDGFRAGCQFIFDETTTNLPTEEVAPFSTIFVKGDYLKEFFTKIHPKLPPYILVTHNSDDSAPGEYISFLEEEKVVVWFAQNVDRAHPKLEPIPIGIANQYWKHGNPRVIKEVEKRKIEKKHLLYLNIAVSTYPKERKKVHDLFHLLPWAYSTKGKSFRKYLEDLAASQFVASPRGNGLDTHRLWEALYLGSYPIVKSSPLDPLYQDLPVVIVKDWEEITEEFLLQEYEKLESSYFSRDKLEMEYWIQKINSYRQR